jgi:hypothetical protein
MLLQTKEGREPRGASIKQLRGWYLVRMICAEREEGFWISLYPCFARRAWLNSTKSRNPRPPTALERPILSQDIQ